jgi:hypothetical protein
MPRFKTLLTPQQQWECTIAYMQRIHRKTEKEWKRAFFDAHHQASGCVEKHAYRSWRWIQEQSEGPGTYGYRWVCVVKRNHRLLIAGNVLFCQPSNGMLQRFPLYGVSTKGARLRHYYLSIASPYNESGMVDFVELPGDLISARWDDPAIGRFVADLRASSRRRVGASIPAPMQMPLSGVRTQGLQFDGYYGAGRVPRPEQARHRRRFYLRFFPDGTVIRGYFPYPRTPINPESFGEGLWGEVLKYSLRDGGALSFSVVRNGEVKVRYEGHTLDGRLRLTRYMSEVSRPRDLPREYIFRFFQWPK